MSPSETTPGGAGRQHGQKGNKGQSKSRSGKSKKRKHKSRPRTIPPDAVVSLTPQGRDFYNMLLQAASIEAGRPIVGEDLLEVLRRVRAETGQSDPQFKDPVILECFRKHLRVLGDEKSA